MYKIKLNKNETISLDINTILSCMYIFNVNYISNNKLCDDCLIENTNIILDLMLEDNKENFLNNNIVRKSILLG